MKDVTPLLMHWSYVFLALNHRYVNSIWSKSTRTNHATNNCTQHIPRIVHMIHTSLYFVAVWHNCSLPVSIRLPLWQWDINPEEYETIYHMDPLNWSVFISKQNKHYNDVIMGTIMSQITTLTIVYSTVYSGTDQRKHESSASLAFVRGSHWGPVNSPHKWPVTRKMFPFDDVIMRLCPS